LTAAAKSHRPTICHRALAEQSRALAAAATATTTDTRKVRRQAAAVTDSNALVATWLQSRQRSRRRRHVSPHGTAAFQHHRILLSCRVRSAESPKVTLRPVKCSRAFMAALCNTAGHYIFAPWFLSLFFFFLWSPYVIGQTIIFSSCSFFLPSSSIYLLFFPRLISAVGDWMSTILLHMAWP